LKNYKVTVNGQSFTVIVEELNQQQTAKANTLSAPVEAAKPASAASHRQNEGDTLLILEAMKMENEITAPQSGTVVRILVKAGDTVNTGDILMVIA
jgi:biotin carboxyl carrier protein